ncbi:MAG: hypothetical protein Q7R85_01645 [bacterium]|nr:hypothetical protein [bacterium]
MKEGHCGRFHWLCCARPILAKLTLCLAAFALILAWVASAKADGMVCFKARVDGKCPSGLPVAHLFWDALILGVLSTGLGNGQRSGMCTGGKCEEGESEE